MRLDSTVYLIAYAPGENDIGDSVMIETPREIFAEKNSVRQSEFYQAAASGLKPEITFKIRDEEYNGELSLVYENKKYTIIRSYSISNDGMTELVCSGLVNGVM